MKRKKIKLVEILLDEDDRLSSTRSAAAYIIVCLITPVCLSGLFATLTASKASLIQGVLASLGLLAAACLGVGQYSKTKSIKPPQKEVKGP